MIIKNPEKKDLRKYFDNLNNCIEAKGCKWVKYLDLGIKTVRLINYSDEFTPLVQKQLTYVIKDFAENYDETIVIWKEDDFEHLAEKLGNEFNPKTNLRIRIEMLALKLKNLDLGIFDEKYSKFHPILDLNPERGFINAYDMEKRTYYYGVRNLEPEEFIKEGHIFVQMFNKILKTKSSNLVHGAVVGLNNNGILFCARGQRGKSTLAVLAMMRGFEYVSDDYLVLEKKGNQLFTHPIYSIITLSPRMYNELYYELEGKFVSNNARKDKYVINIEKYHHTFMKNYPIKVCMFPEIVEDKEPSVRLCTPQEKGRAITHLIHSTINQMGDRHDIKTVQKLINMVKNLNFYKINLCSDIGANVECLREFSEKIKENENELCIK